MFVGQLALICFLFLPLLTLAQENFDSSNDQWPVVGNSFLPGDVQVSGQGLEAVYSLSGNGDGLGITDGSDEGFYIFTEKDDSWSIQGRFSWGNAPNAGSVGLMIREAGQDPSARHIMVGLRVVDGTERSEIRYRNILSIGGLPTYEILNENSDSLIGSGDGVWFRLTHVKSLFLFLTEYSLDGENWILASRNVFAWSSVPLAYGLFISSDSDDDSVVDANVDRVSLAPSPPVIERSFSKPVFAANDSILVSLDVHNAVSVDQVTVEETIPVGWSIANISHNGQFSDGTITWNISNIPTGLSTLTYEAIAPASPDSQAYWDGAIVDGLQIIGKTGLLLSGGDVDRVLESVLILYDFTEGEGDVVHDKSGAGEPIDLTIQDPGNVTWGAGSLRIDANTKIRSMGPAPKLFDTFTDFDHDGSITVEAWIAPANTEQTGPARLVTYSDNPSNRNFTLGQSGDFYQFRLRTGYGGENPNGTQPYLETPSGTVTTTLTHVAFVRDIDWNTYIYVNGSLASDEGSSTLEYFDNWNPDYDFGLANEINQERPWLGEFFLVCIYSRGLTGDEVAQNFAAGVEIPDVSVNDWSLF